MSVMLVLFSLVRASAAAPIALSCGFTVGDEVRMLVTSTLTTRSLPAITNRTTARITVTEADPQGWVFNWAFGPIAFDAVPGLSAADLQPIQWLERIDDQATIRVRTDRNAAPLRLANLDEVKAHRARGVAAFEATLAAENYGGPVTAGMIADARSVSASDTALTEYWLGQVVQVHSVLCTKYAEGAQPPQSATTADGRAVTITTSATRAERTAKIEVTREMKSPGAMTDRLTVELTPGEAWPTLVRGDLRNENIHQVVTFQRID